MNTRTANTAYTRDDDMILILSKSELEPTTEVVMDWLTSFGAEFMRLNGDDLHGDTAVRLTIPDSHIRLGLDGVEMDLPLDQITTVWYRRWQNDKSRLPLNVFRNSSDDALRSTQNIERGIAMEARRLSEFLFSQLEKRTWISQPSTAAPNKLNALKAAAAANMGIPKTLVTTKKRDVEKFHEDCGSIITKPLSESQFLSIEDKVWVSYTAEISEQQLEKLPKSFPPSLFQEKLDKEYELRIFYLDETCYPMAIFSQSDKQTQVDFRAYNFKKPNRFIPYSLSEELEEAAHRFMNSMNLNTGSLDLVKTTDGRVVFLEVNPIGQFGMVSKPCNYHLERKMAELLAREDMGNAQEQ